MVKDGIEYTFCLLQNSPVYKSPQIFTKGKYLKFNHKFTKKYRKNTQQVSRNKRQRLHSEWYNRVSK